MASKSLAEVAGTDFQADFGLFCFVLALSISTAAEKLSATDISVQEQLVEELTLAMGDLKSRVGPKTLDELVCSIYELLYYHLVIIMVQA